VRPLVAIFLLLPALAGCLAKSDGAAALPVVELTSTFERRLENGTKWEPDVPRHHGCPDTFKLDPPNERIHLYAKEPGARPDARAALSLPDRDPEAYDPHQNLSLPTRLPYTEVLGLGNEDGDSTLLLVNRGVVSFDGMELVVLEPLDRTFHYAWRTENGTVLRVTETIRATYFGDWAHPLRQEPERICI
jgi:hypothetical protein